MPALHRAIESALCSGNERGPVRHHPWKIMQRPNDACNSLRSPSSPRNYLANYKLTQYTLRCIYYTPLTNVATPAKFQHSTLLNHLTPGSCYLLLITAFQPLSRPSAVPSQIPSEQPTQQPTVDPTKQPFSCPSSRPSFQPTDSPSRQPATSPSGRPTVTPSTGPSFHPSPQPTLQPRLVEHSPCGRMNVVL